jgi:hypothetical protein
MLFQFNENVPVTAGLACLVRDILIFLDKH